MIDNNNSKITFIASINPKYFNLKIGKHIAA